MRAKAKVITLISARSRSPTTQGISWVARLIDSQHRGLPGLDHMLRPAHGMCRIGGDDLASDQPVEQHADGGKVLLDRRLLEIFPQRLDIGGDM